MGKGASDGRIPLGFGAEATWPPSRDFLQRRLGSTTFRDSPKLMKDEQTPEIHGFTTSLLFRQHLLHVICARATLKEWGISV